MRRWMAEDEALIRLILWQRPSSNAGVKCLFGKVDVIRARAWVCR
jgi:hypothetical protein